MKGIICFVMVVFLPLGASHWERPKSWLDEIPDHQPMEDDSLYRAFLDSLDYSKDSRHNFYLLKMDSLGKLIWSRGYDHRRYSGRRCEISYTDL